jgi:hypothetical protein
MKKKISTLFLILCLMPYSLVLGQTTKNPSWIIGTWGNSLISDLRKSVIWSFNQDSIFIETGVPTREKKCLSSDYSGYKQSQILNDNLYQVIFSKENEKVVYEFKQFKDVNIGKPAFTYSLTINGVKKVEHSTGAYLTFYKK